MLVDLVSIQNFHILSGIKIETAHYCTIQNIVAQI